MYSLIDSEHLVADAASPHRHRRPAMPSGWRTRRCSLSTGKARSRADGRARRAPPPGDSSSRRRCDRRWVAGPGSTYGCLYSIRAALARRDDSEATVRMRGAGRRRSPRKYPAAHKLDAEHAQRWRDTLVQRLVAAAERLAALLNASLKDQRGRCASRSERRGRHLPRRLARRLHSRRTRTSGHTREPEACSAACSNEASSWACAIGCLFR